MTKKFTTTEYARIIDAWETSKGYVAGLKRIITLLQGTNIGDGDGETTMRALALANPVTRELVYDKYVKDSKFIWHDHTNEDLVINTSNGEWYLDAHDPNDDEMMGVNSKFTEKEIASSPFNPDWFNKEEVK